MERHSMRCGTAPGPARALRIVPPAANRPGWLALGFSEAAAEVRLCDYLESFPEERT